MLKELHIDSDVGKISNLGDITVTPGFTMLLVRGQIESNESGIVALELTPANVNDKELLVNLVELLSPPTNSVIDKDKSHEYEYPSYDWMEYNCGIAKGDLFHKFGGSYIVTIPAGSGNIPDFLGHIDGFSQNQYRPLLFLLLFIQG